MMSINGKLVIKFRQLLQKRRPILIQTDLALFIYNSSLRSSISHVCNSNCNALNDGANSSISSAYKIIHIGTKPMVHPTFCSSTILIMSLMYKAHRYGDKTPPCLIPRNKQYVSENVELYHFGE